jgi:hypothetical protein
MAYESTRPLLDIVLKPIWKTGLEYVAHNYEDKGALRRTSSGSDLPPGRQKSFQNAGTELR